MTRVRPLGLFIALLACMASVSAQTTYTWNQTTSGNWNGATWINGTPVGASDATLAFGGTTAYTATNNIGPFTLNTMNFSSTGAVTVASSVAANNITFAGTGGGINIANGTGAVTISSGLVYGVNTTITNGSSNTLNLTGLQTFSAGVTTTYAGNGNININALAVQPNGLTFQNGSGITYTGNGALAVGPQGINAAANSLNTISFANNGTYNFTNGVSGGGNTGSFSMGDNASGGANTTILYNAATGVTLNFANYSSGLMTVGNFGNLAGTININAGAVRFGIVGGTANTGGDLFGAALTLNVASGASFNLNGNGETMGAITGSGTIIQGNSGLTMQQVGTYTWGGVLQGTGGFSTGAANINYTFSGNNTSTGNTTVVAGSSLTLGNGGTSGTVGGNIANTGTLNINRSDAFTFGNVISGVGVVNVNGTGTTTLSATNTYTGATTVSNGTLRVQGRTAGSAYTVNDGAGIIFRNTAIATPFAATTLTIGSAGATNLGFEFNGGLPTGTQTVVNVATSNGLTLNGTSTINVSSTGTFANGQYALLKYAGTIQGNGGFAGLTLNTSILPFRITGSLVNNTANSSIDVLIAGDFIKWNGNVAGQVWDINNTANFVLNSNSTATNYIQSGADVDSPLFDDTATNTTVNMNSVISPNAVTVNTANTYTFQGSGKISGATGLTKQGAGTLIISTDNDYTGGTSVGAGILQLGNGGTTGSIAGSISGTGTVVVNRSEANYVLTNALTGTVGLTMTGANTVTLSGTSTTTGAFNLNSGTVQVSTQANLGGDSTINFNGGTLKTTGTIDTSGSGAAATQRFVVGTSGGTLDVAAGTLFNKRGDQVTGTGTLTKIGDGLFGLGSGGTSTLAALNVNQGGFRLTSQRTGSLGALNMASGTTLYLLDTSSFTLTGQFSIASGATIFLNGGDGANITGISGNANILGTSTGSGAFLHTLDEAGSANAGVNSAISLTGNNRFTMLNVRAGNNVADTVTTTFNQAISGTGGIIKDGNGTMVINSTSTYSGNTTVVNGTLRIGTGGSINNSAVITVNSGKTLDIVPTNFTVGGTTAQTLQGTGNITGAVTVGGSGTVRADVGSGTGALNTGNLTINSGGTLRSNLGAVGTSSTLALGGNTLNLLTGSNFVPFGVSGFAIGNYGDYTIATATAPIQLDGVAAGSDATLGLYSVPSGSTGAVNIDLSSLGFNLQTGESVRLHTDATGNILILTYIPVPEPAMMLGIAAGLTALGAALRRKS
jgi:autotransporter-associated beta strand protein